jgi:hypothetical protein
VNLREGTRRLALLLGVVGIILGGFASYAELQSVLGQRTRHVRFEQLADSDAVKKEHKDVESGWFTVASPPDPSCNNDCSAVNRDGIKTIHWGKNYGIQSIATEDGQTFYPTAAPAGWTYLLIALFPVLGFLIPWGAVRAIGWVGAGFVAGPK